jgi:hypothetical protein
MGFSLGHKTKALGWYFLCMSLQHYLNWQTRQTACIMNRLLLRTAINDLMNAVRIITGGNQFHLHGTTVWQPLAEGTLYHNHTAATGQVQEI